MPCHACGNCYKRRDSSGRGRTHRKFKRRQRHSLPFGLFLAAVGALLLPAALAPRANAADFSGIGIQGSQFSLNNQPLEGSARPADTALFNIVFSNQPNLTVGQTVGTLHMTDGVAQNVTISGTAADPRTQWPVIRGTGILSITPMLSR